LDRIRSLRGTDRLDKMQEIVDQMREKDVLEVILSTENKTPPRYHQTIFTRNYPKEFVNSLVELDSI